MDLNCWEGLRRTARLWSLFEQGAIVLMMVTLVSVALYQIVLRNFFSTGLIWGDNFLRHLVLWIGFLGACRATAEGKHIQIDLAAMVPPGHIRTWMSLFQNIFLTAVCAALLYGSWLFLQNERSAEDYAFLQIPYWWLETIFPLAFTVMTIRNLIRLGQRFRSLVGPQN
jgi:C4-dicarboxylate transporter, DctQ subunit